jgi:hypothetical protein
METDIDIIHVANATDTAVFIASAYKMFGEKFICNMHALGPEVYPLKFGGGREARGVVRQTLIALK